MSARTSEADVARCGQYGDKYSMRSVPDFPRDRMVGEDAAGSAAEIISMGVNADVETVDVSRVVAYAEAMIFLSFAGSD